MSDYAYDCVLIDPTPDQIHNAVCDARDAANPSSARARFVDPQLIYTFTSNTDREGAIQWDGGGVPNSYRQRAETSVLGVAWWTDDAGRKHVRFIGGRVDAPKSSYGRRGAKLFGLTDKQYDDTECVTLVYPALCVPRPLKTEKGLLPEILRAIEEDPLDRASWMALSDHVTEAAEAGTPLAFVLSPARCTAALAVLDAIDAIPTEA